MRRSVILGLMMAPALVASAAAATGPSLQDRQQAACYEDVMRLCSNYIPDPDQVKACMRGKKKLVSAECAAFYPPGQN